MTMKDICFGDCPPVLPPNNVHKEHALRHDKDEWACSVHLPGVKLPKVDRHGSATFGRKSWQAERSTEAKRGVSFTGEQENRMEAGSACYP